MDKKPVIYYDSNGNSIEWPVYRPEDGYGVTQPLYRPEDGYQITFTGDL